MFLHSEIVPVMKILPSMLVNYSPDMFTAANEVPEKLSKIRP